jgi:hypothetical protein
MLNVVMLSVVMLSVVMLSVLMLNEVAPLIVSPRLNKLASKRLHHFSLTRGDQAGGRFKAICTYQHQSNRQNKAVTTKKIQLAQNTN